MPDGSEPYGTHRDLLHEWPEAEESLREWKERRALAAVRRALARDCRRRADEAIESILRGMKAAGTA